MQYDVNEMAMKNTSFERKVRLQAYVEDGNQTLEILFCPSQPKNRCVSLMSYVEGEGEVETNLSFMTSPVTESASHSLTLAQSEEYQKEKFSKLTIDAEEIENSVTSSGSKCNRKGNIQAQSGEYQKEKLSKLTIDAEEKENSVTSGPKFNSKGNTQAQSEDYHEIKIFPKHENDAEERDISVTSSQSNSKKKGNESHDVTDIEERVSKLTIDAEEIENSVTSSGLNSNNRGNIQAQSEDYQKINCFPKHKNDAEEPEISVTSSKSKSKKGNESHDVTGIVERENPVDEESKKSRTFSKWKGKLSRKNKKLKNFEKSHNSDMLSMKSSPAMIEGTFKFKKEKPSRKKLLTISEITVPSCENHKN